MADKSSCLYELTLCGLKMICFVGHRSHAPDITTICFLAWNYNDEVVHCMVHCDKVFMKKIDKEMSDYYVQTESLGSRAKEKSFTKLISEIIKVDSLHDID